MKIQEIRDKSYTERRTLLTELADKVRKLRFDVALREAKNVRDLRAMKKDIARIHTVNREESVVDNTQETK
jgi:ribosomal protein L29